MSAGVSTTAFAEVAGPNDGGHITASFTAPDDILAITTGQLNSSSARLNALLSDQATFIGAYAIAFKRRDP